MDSFEKKVLFNKNYIKFLEQLKNKKAESSEEIQKSLKLYKKYQKNYKYIYDLKKIINNYKLDISLNMSFDKFQKDNASQNVASNFDKFYNDFRSIELELISKNKVKDAFNELNQLLKSVNYEYDPELNYGNFVEGKISYNSIKHKDVLSVKSDKPNGTIVKLVYGGIIDQKTNQFVFKSEVYVSLNL